MKKRIIAAALLVLVAMTVTALPATADDNTSKASALDYYVSPDGDDTNSGKKDAPFATIQAARDAIRELKATSGLPNGGITVHIAEGTYYLQETLSFTADDSGTADCPITYVGEGNVLLSGGYFLDPSDFSPVSSESIKERLKENVRDTVLEYDLKILNEAGIDWGKDYQYYMNDRDYKYEHIFYVNGVNYHLARYPDYEDGFMLIDQVIPHEQSDQLFWIHTQNNALEETLTWDWDNQFVLMGGYMCSTFLYMESPAWKIEDRNGEAWALVQKEDGNPGKVINTTANRIYFHNILEALDSENEYYIDKENEMMYIYPCENFDEADIVIPYFNNDYLVKIDASYITLDNIDIQYTARHAMNLNGDHNSILNCEISCTFLKGIIGNCTNTVIDHCKIHDIGTEGINLSGGSDFTLEPAGNIISNCDIYEWAQRDTWCMPGASVNNGCVIRNNEFHDSKCGAITFGNNVTIEYNVFHDLNKEMWDNGIAHSGGSQWNTDIIIRYNYGYNCYCVGMYFDNGLCNGTIEGNILVNIGNGVRTVVQGNGIHTNTSRGCNISNNIIVNAYTKSISAASNIMWNMDGDLQGTFDRITLDVVRMRNPNLLLNDLTLYMEATADCPQSPGYFTVENNVMYGTNKTFASAARLQLGLFDAEESGISDEYINSGVSVRNNLEGTIDPEFVDISGDLSDIRNANLREDSIVYDILPGFERIPIEKIGIDNYNK